jgi:hypothetical protein
MTIQISNFHISDKSKIDGSAKVALLPHRAGPNSGIFTVRVSVGFDPGAGDYPTGSVSFDIDLTDSFKGSAASTSIEQVNSFGKHTPTVVITGRCKVTLADGKPPLGCRFWLLVANNKKPTEQGTPDVVSFVIYDRNGSRVSYGTGPVASGDIEIAPTGL